MEGKRILFFNRFYWPDESATAQILVDLAEHLSSESHSIKVVTSRLRYETSGGAPLLPASESHNGVEISRLWSTSFGRGALFGRLLDYLSIYMSFFCYLLFGTRPGDIVVVKTDPPLLSILGWIAGIIKPIKLVSWCQDLFPEIAEHALGSGTLTRPGYAALKCLRNASLNKCDMVVVLSEDMKNHLLRQGTRSHIEILPNWAIQTACQDRVSFVDLRREWKLSDRIVLGYSGNLGRAHDVDTFISAAVDFVELEQLTLLFIGGGAGLRKVQHNLNPDALKNTVFLPYQPKEILSETLRVPDIHWFSLNPEMNAHVYPSKFYGILQSGRPVIFVGDPDSELARMIRQYNCGLVAAPGDSQGLVKCVRSLYENEELRKEMGSNALDLDKRVTNRASSLKRWETALSRLMKINDL